MDNSNQKYVAVMFPYPSGSGLHIGHSYNYAITDSYCRYLRYKGQNVFQPFGYDAFGLPAENYAKSVGREPWDVTYENIERFREQIKKMDTKFEELLITSDSSYTKWTQWIFIELYKRGLAYKKMGIVNWDPIDQTVLANEQVKDGIADRSGAKVEQREMEQWYFKITDYTERLKKNLDWIDYPKSTINAQRAWLENQHDWCVSRQRSWGCPIPIEGETDTLDTFVDSSFYTVRYCDPNNENELCSKEKYRPVDLYIGGSEHACMHLIYARFIHMFLYDIGIVSQEEPFNKVIHQGMILYNGEKMSKTKGNVINPDDYDSDELRFYLMFIGHYFDGGSWSDQNISGVQRFIRRFSGWMNMEGYDHVDLTAFKKQIEDFTEAFKFNKVVSTFMTFYNQNKGKKLTFQCKEELIALLEIYMPGIRKKINNEHN